MRTGRIHREQRKLAAAPDTQRPVHTGLVLCAPDPLKGPNMARGGVNSLFKNSTNPLEQEVSK